MYTVIAIGGVVWLFACVFGVAMCMSAGRADDFKDALPPVQSSDELDRPDAVPAAHAAGPQDPQRLVA